MRQLTLALQKINRLRFAILVAIATLATPSNAQEKLANDWDRMRDIVPQGYVCHRANGSITIDGKLDDPSWQAAAWTKDFADIEGGRKPKPAYRTRAKMLWDDDYFYVAAELEEPQVWATLTEHDAVIFQDNDFEVFIDPDGDSHDYFEFEMNALNTGWDLRLTKPYKDGGQALNSWEIPGLKTAVHVNGTLNDPRDRDQGWSVEIAFPWPALAGYANRPTPPQEGERWRVNFSRVEWPLEIVDRKYRKTPGRKENNWVWSPQGVIDMHRPEKWAYVQFTRKQPGAAPFVPDPAFPARQALQGVYYAQRAFRAKNNRWAASLEELGLPAGAMEGLAGPPTIESTKDGYEATAEIKPANSKSQRWHIRQDARVWSD